MKIKLYYYPVNCGDGSVAIHFFSTEKKMMDYATIEESRDWYEGFGEDCSGEIEFEVDKKGKVSGKYLDPIHEDDEEDYEEDDEG